MSIDSRSMKEEYLVETRELHFRGQGIVKVRDLEAFWRQFFHPRLSIDQNVLDNPFEVIKCTRLVVNRSQQRNV